MILVFVVIPSPTHHRQSHHITQTIQLWHSYEDSPLHRFLFWRQICTWWSEPSGERSAIPQSETWGLSSSSSRMFPDLKLRCTTAGRHTSCKYLHIDTVVFCSDRIFSTLDISQSHLAWDKWSNIPTNKLTQDGTWSTFVTFSKLKNWQNTIRQ